MSYMQTQPFWHLSQVLFYYDRNPLACVTA